MARRRSSIWVASACLAAAVCAPARPQQQEPTGAESRKIVAWLHDVYLREASEYQFFVDTPKRHELKLRREPVMRWISAGSYNGEVYVWTDDGAAAIAGCIFSRELPDGRHIMHEFHSLCREPLHADRRGGSGWLSEEPGIRPLPVPDAPEPADSPTRRLAQMGEIARRFTAQVSRQNSKWEMRLLPRPLYRYEIADERSPVVDGALFTFVWTAGTDPEALLMIEARRTEDGIRWEYAPVRFTNREAWMQYRGKEVWHVDVARAGNFDGVTTKAYGAFGVKTVPIPAGR